MTMKRETIHATKTYNPDEVKAMAEAGYIPAREAADLCHVRIDRVYRATKPRKVRGKNLKAPVRVKLGTNAWNRYVHRQDWLDHMADVRQKAKAELGLGK